MTLKTGAEYRHANKLRVQNHRKSMEARGYRAKTVFLSDDFQQTVKEICEEHRIPQHEAFDLILVGYRNHINTTNLEYDAETLTLPPTPPLQNLLANPPDNHQNKQNEQIPDILPDCHGKELSVEERDAFLFQVERMFPGPGMNRQRADALNDANIKTGRGKAWTPKAVGDNLLHARRRQGR